MYRVLDIFSGIGGFSLGLESTGGFRTVAFCESAAHPRAVLARHWTGVPIYDDVRTLTADALRRDGIADIDVIAGGFPCQDISRLGSGAGLAGERSALWGDFARLIGELRPRFALVENSAMLIGRGLGDVLGDLAARGYDATWDCIPAAAVGAPHLRDRIWIVAHADCGRRPAGRAATRAPGPGRGRGADAAGGRAPARALPDAHGPRSSLGQSEPRDDGAERAAAFRIDWWTAEPDVGRVVDGFPERVERIKALGNAVVPQIPALIGRAILAAEHAQAAPQRAGER